MRKNVIDFYRLPKQEYMQPTLEVVTIGECQQLMAGSVKSLNINVDDLTIDPNDIEGNMLDDAY